MKAGVAALLWAAALLWGAALLSAQSVRASAAPTSQHDLIGSWRLVSIGIVGPDGRSRADPFYRAAASGLLIYDASGWVSVQIASLPRPKVDAPAARSQAAGDAQAAQQKASLLDSYYAYIGTWEYDAHTGTVTHQVTVSLYSGEEGARYTQQVQLNGTQMVFTRALSAAAGGGVQKKVWERIAPRMAR